MSYTAAVITISDKGYRKERKDTSGPAVAELLRQAGYDVVYQSILPDEQDQICKELLECTDSREIALVLTTGGTGFSPRDVTPEAALKVIEREVRGIPELMRSKSNEITDRGCLSRSVAGIRKRSLIVTLPGSEKAAKENLMAVLSPISHGLDMLMSAGSADCGEPHQHQHAEHEHPMDSYGKMVPSLDAWMKEAKAHPDAGKIGMYLTHNGVVRRTAKAEVRNGKASQPVTGMMFSYDKAKADAAVEETYRLPGIYYVRIWLAEGSLKVGDDIMYVLIGGDIRPNVVAALEYLVGKLKSQCVSETEL